MREGSRGRMQTHAPHDSVSEARARTDRDELASIRRYTYPAGGTEE